MNNKIAAHERFNKPFIDRPTTSHIPQKRRLKYGNGMKEGRRKDVYFLRFTTYN